MLGTKACASIGVADPKRRQAMTPSTINNDAGIQLAIAPTFISHLPTFSPTTFNVTARASPAIDAMMK